MNKCIKDFDGFEVSKGVPSLILIFAQVVPRALSVPRVPSHIIAVYPDHLLQPARDPVSKNSRLLWNRGQEVESKGKYSRPIAANRTIKRGILGTDPLSPLRSACKVQVTRGRILRQLRIAIRSNTHTNQGAGCLHSIIETTVSEKGKRKACGANSYS